MKRYPTKIMATVLMTSWFAIGGLPTAAQAEVIAESDTGMVFPDRDCEITLIELIDVQFYTEHWNHLSANVTWEYECVGRGGRVWLNRDTESVLFPTLTYDRQTQGWFAGDTQVAERCGRHGASLLDGFFHTVWSNNDEGMAISFRVQIEQP